MPRKLQPCGTRAAYARHLYKKEDPCEACKAANAIRASSSPSGGNAYMHDMDRALEANPPVIHWRKNSRGIFVATSINDPHAESTTHEQARRMRRAAEQAEREIAVKQLEQIRIGVLELMQEEADEVAERFRQHRANNTPLMTAARTEI